MAILAISKTVNPIIPLSPGDRVVGGGDTLRHALGPRLIAGECLPYHLERLCFHRSDSSSNRPMIRRSL